MYVMYSRHNKRATRLIYEHKLFFQVSVSLFNNKPQLVLIKQ